MSMFDQIDQPFDVEAVSQPISFVPHAMIVNTPVGDEVVPLDAFDEPTSVTNPVELAALLADASPHTHATVPSFHAVEP